MRTAKLLVWLFITIQGISVCFSQTLGKFDDFAKTSKPKNIPIDHLIIRQEFYKYYYVKDEEQFRKTNAFIDRKTDSLQRTFMFENIFQEYEKESGIQITEKGKTRIKSEAIGFLLYMFYNKNQIRVLRSESIDWGVATKASMAAFLAPSSNRHQFEYYYVDTLHLKDNLFEYMAMQNKERKYLIDVADLGTAKYWASEVAAESEAKYGYLRVTSDVKECAIYIDKTYESQTDDELVVPIPSTQRVTVTVLKTGYQPHSETVILNNGTWSEVKAKMKKL